MHRDMFKVSRRRRSKETEEAIVVNKLRGFISSINKAKSAILSLRITRNSKIEGVL